MTPLLEVQDLTTRFYTLDGVVHAVNGISYTLEEGEMLGIVGESACGKSVSVLSVMGLIPEPPGKIAAGQVLYKGQDLLQLDQKQMERIRGREISMVFQDPMTSLNPVLTIGRQIGEVLIVHLGMSKENAHQRTVEMLDIVGIPQAVDRYADYPHQFSGGMRQRTMIAMALACNPSILIADEPTTALDVTIQAQIIDLVKALRNRLGMAVIWITHDLAVIAELADRVLVMYAGFIVEEAGVDTLFEDPRHPYTLALLRSLPRVDRSSDERLTTIPGFPPDGFRFPKGCPFTPRCVYAMERCHVENPRLEMIALDHSIACWMDVTTGRKR
ncbi:MAG: ABC transporter ATP-binding protein [Anaerolineales bacterium]|nr:MAG: ABC transporter ATP-binding protein [Anaerolineales bacterium]